MTEESPPATPASSVCEIPREFRCPLTLDVMHSPVRLKTAVGASYEREAVEFWLDLHPRRDPLTNADYGHDLEVEADDGLAKAIGDWRVSLGLPEKSRSRRRLSLEHRPQAVKRWLAQLHRRDTALVEEAALELAGLSESSDEDRVAVRKLGGLDLLLAALREGATDGVRVACAHALAQLARNGDNRYAIANAGGVSPLVRMLRAASADCREAGALALWRMARTYKDWIAVAVEPLVALLDETDHEPARANAAKALWRLSVVEQHRAEIVKAGGLHKLVRLIDSHHAPPHTRQVAAWALFNIAGSHDRALRAKASRSLGLHFAIIRPNLPAIRRHLDRRLLAGTRTRAAPRSLSPPPSRHARPSASSTPPETPTAISRSARPHAFSRRPRRAAASRRPRSTTPPAFT